jgi:hypothetical protein
MMTRLIHVVVGAMVVALATAAPAQADGNRAFDRDVDPTTLTRADLAAIRPADLPRLPPRVRDLITTPVSTETVSTVEDNASLRAVADTCYHVQRNTYRKNGVGWVLMQVRNKARVCTTDRIYHSITPIDLSQAWGNWGYSFRQWDVNSSGFCTSSHLWWYHVLQARFTIGHSPDLFRLTNQATFHGNGGVHGGYC